MTQSPIFRVGYDGETEYTWKGRRYAIRHHQAQTIRAECQAEEDNRIGVVWCASHHHDYPPAELAAHFPGYVRGRYIPTGETYQVNTTSGPITVPRCQWENEEPPRVEATPHGLRAAAWREGMEKAGVTV